MKSPATPRTGFFLALFALVAATTSAQIPVTPAGSGLLMFDSAPSAGSWATKSLGSTASAPESNATLDQFVNGSTNAAGTINQPVASNAGDPPAAAALAMWSGGGGDGYVITRPTLNSVTLLMAVFTNATATNLHGFQVRYTYTQKLSTSTVGNEVVKGHRVYFNRTGAAGAWTPLGNFGNSFTTNLAQNIGIDIDLGGTPWSGGTLFYLLFADDNSNVNNDGANAIDNFAIVVPAPVITNQPQPVAATPGLTVGFNVGASGASPLFYQWRKDGAAIPGATNGTLVLSNITPADAACYSVVVSNTAGVAVSSNACLTLECGAAAAFAAQPQAQTLSAGGALTISAAASGSIPITYQWHRNGVPIPDATNATHLKPGAQPDDTGRYHVVINNCVGTPAVSSTALVAVAEAPFTVVGLTNHLWRYRNENTNLDLGDAWKGVEYDDSGWPSGRGIFAVETDAPSVQARTNTVLVLNHAGGENVITHRFRTRFVFTNEPGFVSLAFSNYFDDGGAVHLNSNELFRINMPAGSIDAMTSATTSGPNPEGSYHVTTLPGTAFRPGTNTLAAEVHQYTTSSSDVAFGLDLRVVPLPPTPLAITMQPQPAAVEELRPASITVGYTGQLARVQWFRQTGGGPEAVPGATSPTLDIPQPVQGAHDGAYFAAISNAFDLLISDSVTLVITQAAPVIVSQPQPRQLCPGQPLELNVLAYGSATFAHQWMRDGVPLADATNATLIIPVTATNDSGSYSVIVSNALGTAVSSNAAVAVTLLPFVVSMSDGEGAGVGSPAQFTVAAGGCGPFTYQWQFNGTNIAGATNATLMLTNVQLSDEGLYRVLVANAAGVTASSEAPLVASIGAALNAPHLEWTTPPGFWPGGWLVEGAETHDGVASLRLTGVEAHLQTTVNGPARLSFWSRLSGTFEFLYFRIDGRLELQWSLETPWNRREFYIPAGSHVLAWEARGSLAGTNTVVFLDQITLSTNDLGPAVLSAPQNMTVPAGGNFFFDVVADGFPPLHYQWQFNGSNLAGANQSIFASRNAQPAASGAYTVVVSNEFGVATAGATLTVTGAPPSFFGPARVLAVPGRDVVLNAQARGSEPMTFQWRLDGTPVAGATNWTLVLPHGPTNWPGRYSVVAGNALGTVAGPEIEIVSSRVTRVIQLSMDGLAAGHLFNGVVREPQRFPSLGRLMREGAFTFNARCDVTHSITVPNHLCMILGRPVLQPAGQPDTVHHGYTNNYSIAGLSIHEAGNTNAGYFASVFDVVHDRGGSTALFTTKSSLAICGLSYDATHGAPDLLPPDHGRAKIDFAANFSASAGAVDACVPRVAAGTDTYSFLHFMETDSAGHVSGWGGAEWFEAVETLDAQLGRIMAAVETNVAPGAEIETVILVTSDHGGEGTEHLDPAAPMTFAVPFFAWGPGFSGGTDLYRLFANRADPGTNMPDYNAVWPPLWNGDSGNFALALLGLPEIPGSTLVPRFPSDTIRSSVAQDNGSLVIEWPTSAVGFTLESSATPGGGWAAVSGLATNANRYRCTVPIAPGTRFFRLRK
jgi:hypothetical protein